jgi:hypothetical protein
VKPEAANGDSGNDPDPLKSGKIDSPHEKVLFIRRKEREKHKQKLVPRV